MYTNEFNCETLKTIQINRVTGEVEMDKEFIDIRRLKRLNESVKRIKISFEQNHMICVYVAVMTDVRPNIKETHLLTSLFLFVTVHVGSRSTSVTARVLMSIQHGVRS